MNRFGRILFLAFALGILAYGCAKPLPDLYWPPPPDEPRIKYVRDYMTTTDLKGTNIAVEIIAGAEANQALKKPMGVYVDAAGKLYVTDTARSDVMMIDTVSKAGRVFGGKNLAKPIGVAVDGKGRIFVADSDTKKVAIFDADGRIITDNVLPNEPLKRPSGIAIDNTRNLLYITDTYDHDIKVFDVNTLKQTRTIGKRGKEDGQFNFPSHLAVDGNGSLFVTDTQNGRVQVFDSDGKFLRKFGEFGDAPGMFARPKGVGVDSEGHVYVADAAFNNVQIFDEEGKILMAFSSYGTDRGQMVLPAGLSVDRDDYIYVVDSWGRRIEVYEYLGEKHKAREAAAAKKK
ncbi:MAG: SMP-30/gluconolactonase/LRE family protein [Deltaproteobacteria bacterium]|nr:SMP-30/gluconolactonase/LRE family protein [Deltaproteobacteria bacterium]